MNKVIYDKKSVTQLHSYKLQPYSINDIETRYHAVFESREHLAPTIPWVIDYTREKSIASLLVSFRFLSVIKCPIFFLHH